VTDQPVLFSSTQYIIFQNIWTNLLQKIFCRALVQTFANSWKSHPFHGKNYIGKNSFSNRKVNAQAELKEHVCTPFFPPKAVHEIQE